jgi:carbamoyltransferase
MLVLGIHKDPWHDTGACAIRFIDGKTEIAYIAEERLDRVKDSRHFPANSTRAVLEAVGASSVDDCDLVVMDYIINKKNWRLDQYRKPCSTANYLSDLSERKIRVINHHLAHAYAVYFSSNFRKAAILVVDGRGSEKETQSLFLADGNEIRLIDKTDCIGIGLLYSAVTHAIGFGLLQEGKTMGLAPYGEELSLKESIFTFSGSFSGIKTDYSSFCESDSYKIKNKYKEIDSFERKALAAFEVQKECERAMLHLAKWAKEKTGADYLCISGGVGLNSVSNNLVIKSGLFKDVFINPAASDTGIPLGAALWGYHSELGMGKDYELISPYLGPLYSDERIERAISVFDGYNIVRKDAFNQAVNLLANNKIVARFEGRSEMGPRALGHRSILMSPLKAENKDILNKRVKFRESFRPFAPAILEERASEFFEIDRPSPYMLQIPKVTNKGKKLTPATTHVDGTARLQTVTKERNGDFYNLIEKFGELTGVPVLLNTSFNIADEPVVETPEDAIKCFLLTSIDALLIEDVLLIKNSIDQEN